MNIQAKKIGNIGIITTTSSLLLLSSGSNPVYILILLITIGLPCLFASPIVWYYAEFLSKKLSFLESGILMLLLTLPSFPATINIWLHFHPHDGPALGYLGLFYIMGSPLWLPLLGMVRGEPNKALNTFPLVTGKQTRRDFGIIAPRSCPLA